MKHLVPIIVAASFLISAASVTTAVIVTNNQNKKIKELEKQISTTVESTLPDDTIEITVEDQDKDKNNNNKDKDKNNKPTQTVYKDKNAQYRQYELNKENTRHESVMKQINDSYRFTASEEATYKTYNYNEVVAEQNRLQTVYNEKEDAYFWCQDTAEYTDHICGDPNEKEHIKEYNDAIDAKVAKSKSERDQAEKEYYDYCKKYERYINWYHSYNDKQRKVTAENELHQKNVNEINQKYR